MAIFQCDLRRKNYGALWDNLFNFFHLLLCFNIKNTFLFKKFPSFPYHIIIFYYL